MADAKLSAVDRLDVYANMYFFRMLDVLRDDYAKVVAVVGDDAFHNLVTDYLVACRPAHPSLREVGARLPGFLARHPSSRTNRGQASSRASSAHASSYPMVPTPLL